jgi:iron complex outermembrane recepter protein
VVREIHENHERTVPGRMLTSGAAMSGRAAAKSIMKFYSFLPALLLASAAAAQNQGALAQSATASSPLQEVVVTATRIEAVAFDIPAAISSVSGAQLRNDALGINLSDDVSTVPGLLARNRYNYAQDQQISIRGIGANSAFGVRGVRVYQDGIPATGPDGQGQVSQFNLDSASRVEILRGPFSALYGNSSGGVIQVFTPRGEGPPQVRTGVVYGSFGNLRASMDALGSAGPLGYNVDFSHFRVDGYRDHSSARSESFNGKFDFSINDTNHLALVTNVISRPDAQDPLGVTPAEFAADPQSTDPAAIRFNTRKSLHQQQAGLIYDLDIDESQSVQVMGYYGHRSVLQFLSIPAVAQAPVTSAGGVVDLGRRYGGADARWSWKGDLADRPMSWVAGVSYDRQNELRRGWNNFVGPLLGVQGALRRNENDIAKDLDEYLQGTWDFASLWSAMIGVRHSDVKFDSEDHYIVLPGNGDDSGNVTYNATSPVAGLTFKPQDWLRAYASFGQGFQTPIGSELAYRPDGGAGLNFALQPQRSTNYELGMKVDIRPEVSAEAAVFQTNTRDEIVVDTNVGGRTTYQNAGRTRRRGVEYSLNDRFSPDWHFQLAYTFINAAYGPSYDGGGRLPGVPRHNVYAVLGWGQESGWHANVNGQYVTNVAVNDNSLTTVFAPSYALFGLDGGYGVELSSFQLNAFLRINNLLNRHYIGSIIVDDGNSRYFEPGPGFAVLSGVTVTFK